MAGVTGDYRALDALIGQLGKLGPEVRRECAAVFAEQLGTLVSEGFDAAQAPDGTPWAPLAPRTLARRRKRSARPLLDTGRLRSSFAITSDAEGVYLSTPVVYAATHQHGRGAIPARPFLPGDVLPSAWAAAFEETARDLMEHSLP